MRSLWSQSDQESLDQRGWHLLSVDGLVDLHDIAAALGPLRLTTPAREVVTTLRVTGQADSHTNSLSSRHGTGAFPYHTDGAFLRTPPRYGIMRLAPGSTSSRATHLLDFERIRLPAPLKEMCARSVWRVHGRSGWFIAGIIEDFRATRRLVRVDFDCMEPADKSFATLPGQLREAFDEAEPFSVDWDSSYICVFDNWRMLHARAAGPPDPARRLERILVGAP